MYVIETDKPLAAALEQLQAESKERIDKQIVDCGEDVTNQYMTSPPGEGTLASLVWALFHNPWGSPSWRRASTDRNGWFFGEENMVMVAHINNASTELRAKYSALFTSTRSIR